MRRVFLLIGAAVGLACAGCAGGSSSSAPAKVSPRTYTTSVCRAFITWESATRKTAAALTVAAPTPAQGKAELVAFFKGGVDDTQTVLTKLKAAGVPNVPEGKRDAQAVIAAFENVSAALQHGETQAQSLPTSDATAYKTAARSLMSSAQSSYAGAFRGLSGLSSPQLDAAAKANPACATLQSGA